MSLKDDSFVFSYMFVSISRCIGSAKSINVIISFSLGKTHGIAFSIPCVISGCPVPI